VNLCRGEAPLSMIFYMAIHCHIFVYDRYIDIAKKDYMVNGFKDREGRLEFCLSI
jgi:hypothetical protein